MLYSYNLAPSVSQQKFLCRAIVMIDIRIIPGNYYLSIHIILASRTSFDSLPRALI